MTTVDFTAFPRTVTTGGSVRLFPIVTGSTLPIVTYYWYFEGGTPSDVSADATPIFNVGTTAGQKYVGLAVWTQPATRSHALNRYT